MQGRIIKGIAGFYYIHAEQMGIYECKAKGGFRNQKIKPLVGDLVEFDIIDEENKKGNITQILPRLNALIRPAVANVDQAMIIFAVAKPAPNLNMLDRFLIMMQMQHVETLICFNKTDISSMDEIENLRRIYAGCGCRILFTSVESGEGLEEVEAVLAGRTTVMAGPSGVGKSSMMNFLKPDADMETGAISRKIERGRHTTRHSQLFHINEGTYVFDTPGFTSLYIQDILPEMLKDYFPEFEPYEGRCRFGGCVHMNEPDCMVKAALAEGKISKSRYDNYVLLYEELKNQKRY